MNTLLWIAQIILAGVFLFTGFSKIFAYGQVVKVVEACQGLRLLLSGFLKYWEQRECWCRSIYGRHTSFCGWQVEGSRC